MYPTHLLVLSFLFLYDFYYYQLMEFYKAFIWYELLHIPDTYAVQAF